MKAQDGEDVGEYKLTDMHLEYEIIESEDLVREVKDQYSVGRSLGYDYTTLLKTLPWSKSSTREVIDVNIPRKSMKAIVLLFTNKDSGDSEEFTYPGLTRVNVTVEGNPNDICSEGLAKRDMYDEEKRFFGSSYVSRRKFYTDKFACVIDFRTVDNDENVSGSGRELIGTQAGILLEIEKETTSTDLSCHVFVVADGIINIVGKQTPRRRILIIKMETPFHMIITGMTACGKTHYLLKMLEEDYKGHFDHIFIKSKYMFIGSSHNIKNNICNEPILINSIPVPRVTNYKCLGVNLDDKLCWDSHIEMICKKVAAGIAAIKRVKPFVPPEMLKVIYNALVQPYFDYCSPLWDNCGIGLKEKLQKYQNRAARILTGATYDIRTADVFETLAWETLEKRRDYLKSIFMYKF